MSDIEEQLRRALYMCAAHCQGGHSDAGRKAAEVLGVRFPLQMDDLCRKAKLDGFDPADLWPWSVTARSLSHHLGIEPHDRPHRRNDR